MIITVPVPCSLSNGEWFERVRQREHFKLLFTDHIYVSVITDVTYSCNYPSFITHHLFAVSVLFMGWVCNRTVAHV